MIFTNKHYSPLKLFSYNAFLNFIIGGRGVGKTFAFKTYLLERYIKYGEQFMYLRRNKSELDRIDKESFFTKEMLEQAFKNFEIVDRVASKLGTKIKFTADNFSNGESEINEMTISSTKIILNGEVVCYMKSLSTWVDLKGSEYDGVMSIMFDEVLIDMSSRKRYLNDEVEALFQLLYSVFRKRKNTKVYLLSNASNTNNPYFNYFHFEGNNSKRFHNLKEFDSVIEFPPDKPITEEEEENATGFFKLIKKSSIYDSVVNNEFQQDNTNNIIKLKGYKRRLYSVYCEGTFLTVYTQNELLYVAKGYDKNLQVYSFDVRDVENGFIYLPRNDSIAYHIRSNFYKGMLYYEDSESKFKFTDAIKSII